MSTDIEAKKQALLAEMCPEARALTEMFERMEPEEFKRMKKLLVSIHSPEERCDV